MQAHSIPLQGFLEDPLQFNLLAASHAL